MRKLFCLLLVTACGSAKGQTLDEYLAMAADSNAALKAKFSEYMASLEEIPQVGALPDPSVEFGYFISPVETRVGAQEARFAVMQMFPWFGTLGAKKDVKTEMAKAKYELFEQAKSHLSYKVKEAYYKLYELKQSIRITGENLEILKTFESLATTKFGSGKAGMVDVLRIQMEIAELKNNLLLWQDKRVPLTAAFNQLLNRDAGSAVVIPDTLEAIELLPDKTILTDSILAYNDQLTGIGHMKRAGEYSVKVARKMGAPSFGLGMNYVLVSERTDMNVTDNGKDAIMPMLSIKLPLYRSKYKAQVRQENLNLEALRYMEKEHRHVLQTQLELAWVEYMDAGRRITLFQEQKKIAEQAKNILIEAYGTSGKDFEEILRVQRMLLKFELETIQAVKDKNTAAAGMETLY